MFRNVIAHVLHVAFIAVCVIWGLAIAFESEFSGVIPYATPLIEAYQVQAPVVRFIIALLLGVGIGTIYHLSWKNVNKPLLERTEELKFQYLRELRSDNTSLADMVVRIGKRLDGIDEALRRQDVREWSKNEGRVDVEYDPDNLPA